MSKYLSHYYPESKFGGFTDIDIAIAFYTRVNSLINSSSVILDFGCGRGAYIEDPVFIRRNLRIFKGKVHKVIGLDVSEVAAKNPFLDEFYLLQSDRWSLDDDSVDLCICDYVLEHIEEPESFFSESRRVLKDGGYLCIRTPNAWGYVALFSKLIPYKSHHKILSKVKEKKNIEEKDVFPTFYRCNTIKKLKSILTKYGFEHVVYGYEPEPCYLSFSRTAYWFGVMYQKLSPVFLSNAIFAFARLHKS